MPSDRLGAIRQQAITNVDPDIYRHIASIGHNELINPISNHLLTTKTLVTVPLPVN